jgi:hypothetical protein
MTLTELDDSWIFWYIPSPDVRQTYVYVYTRALCVKFVLIPSRFSCDYARLCIQFSERDYIIAASTQ